MSRSHFQGGVPRNRGIQGEQDRTLELDAGGRRGRDWREDDLPLYMLRGEGELDQAAGEVTSAAMAGPELPDAGRIAIGTTLPEGSRIPPLTL